MEVPAVNLKAIVLAHWLLTTWGCMVPWIPSFSYAWGNFTILAVGVWAVAQRDSVDAILMFFTGLLLTILTDIVHISLYYPGGNNLSDTVRFSTGMAIFSLLLKPLSCFFAYQMYRERGGEYALNLGFLGVAQDQSSYQSIDHAEPPRPFPDVSSKIAPPRPY
ncbi:type-1 angiotensin II receptor-associated protein-like isoform X1 [Heteronotia binoei]|uniref:type-1 angiotensin II receptor-associated protein-like isoform X1 n=1 Tax=Heteronotia binoei TaxID=13085 RepID=UPI00292E4AE5|nr:type-1 angiotensin II receptor-associated protein-like isoform X1 [Heteronotia binoei]